MSKSKFFPLSHWERVGERACDLDEEFCPVGSVYVLLLKLMCLLTPPTKARVAVRSKPSLCKPDIVYVSDRGHHLHF
jgi:hypothetical protein